MIDATMMGSAAERLMDFVNTTPIRDSNYDIAVLMLRNFAALKNMSINEVSDLCFVSKASITRFCRFIGYDGFKAFHQSLQMDYTISTDYSRPFCEQITKNFPQALCAHMDMITENLKSVICAENIEKAARISRALHDCDRAVYFSHYFMWDIGRQFQSKMMRMGRYVESYLEYNGQYEAARSLKPTDLAIVCSIGGSYTLRHPDIWQGILSSKCKIAAVTQNRINPSLNAADYLLDCGSSNQNDTGKYSTMLALEMVAMDYLRRYGQSHI